MACVLLLWVHLAQRLLSQQEMSSAAGVLNLGNYTVVRLLIDVLELVLNVMPAVRNVSLVQKAAELGTLIAISPG